MNEKPDLMKEAFRCPTCDMIAHQSHKTVAKNIPIDPLNFPGVFTEYRITQCSACKHIALWYDSDLIYPRKSDAPHAYENMQEDIKRDYEEAYDILPYSPRGSCALLRLCIEKICLELGEKDGTLNQKIGNLVAKKIISEDIQKALDSVRIIGNDALHPLAANANFDKKSALVIFQIVNNIFAFFIGKKQIDSVFSSLPEDKIRKISERDQSKSTKI